MRIRNLCLFAVLLLAFGLAPSAMAGKGQVKPYELSVSGMIDVAGITDVEVTVTAGLEGYTAPAEALHIQMKSLDLDGELRWTENVQNVPMLPSGDNASTTAFQYGDVLAHQPLKTHVQIHNEQSGNTKVLRANAAVMLRPDFTVAEVQPNPEIHVDQITNIQAVIRELNGDLGADSTVYLMEGNTVLDTAAGVHLDAMGSAVVVFAATFSEPGPHNLSVVVGDMVPGDYDESNNAMAFSIEVLENRDAAYYYINYSSFNGYRESNYENYYYKQTSTQTGKNESLYYQLYSYDHYFTFPIDHVLVTISADGGAVSQTIELNDIALGSEGTYPCTNNDGTPGSYTYHSSWGNLSPNLYVTVQTYSSTCYGGYDYSYVYIQRYAYDYVYFSSTYYKYNGTQNSYSGYSMSETVPLDATQEIVIDGTMEDDGMAFGGIGVVPVTITPQNYTYDFYSYDTHYWGVQTGELGYGYGSGITTP